jgi:hypothetical protein
MPLKVVYLVLSIAGTVVPFYFFAGHWRAEGFGATPFLAAVFANDAASGFASDLVVASVTFWVAMFMVRQRDKGPAPWGFMAVNLCVGLSAALPLYLFAREQQRSPT